MCFLRRHKAKGLVVVLICFSMTILFGCEVLQEAQRRKQLRTREEMSNQVKPEKNASGGNALVGQIAPDFTLTDLNGGSITLSSLKGKAVLLNFWATW
mgnify:CR=1 FL=1